MHRRQPLGDCDLKGGLTVSYSSPKAYVRSKKWTAEKAAVRLECRGGILDGIFSARWLTIETEMERNGLPCFQFRQNHMMVIGR
jgi:hypothetical protein